MSVEISERLGGAASSRPPSGSRTAPTAGNVREPPTSFLGRTRELRALAEWFDGGERLITLLGSPGCGKTRLAKRFAALHAADYARGGAWFCDLTEARDADEAVACVARTLGASLQGGPDETAIDQLGRVLAAEGPMLLVVDNCEQAAGDIARLIVRWREAAPEARLLATSRERLGVVGERVFDLAPLPVPEKETDAAASEAVQLFVDRARLVRPDYALVDEETRVVASIVRALDGIPLAIELAAARMGLMSAGALLARLDKRFELLADTGREAREHQRTMRAAIDWSWRLLEPWEQATLCQCTVFHGGFTVDAAEAVVDLSRFEGAPPVLDAVQRLRDKSLVYAQSSRELPSEVRLGLYESIREYAAEKLVESGDRDSVEERYAAYFLRVGSAWAPPAESGFIEHARRLEAEMENVAAVHARALARSPRDALRAAIVLDAILGRSGSLHARLEMLERTTAHVRGEVEPALLSEVVWRRSSARLRAGAVQEARADAERALQLALTAHDLGREADAHRLRAVIEWFAGGDAAAHIEAALAASRAISDRSREAQALQVAACVDLDCGDHQRAYAACLRVIALADAAEDKAVAAIARGNLGAILTQLGRHAEAERVLEESTTALYAMRDFHAYFAQLLTLAAVRQERGDFQGAERAHLELIAAAAKAGRVNVRGLSLAMLGALRAASGETEQAARLLDQAEAITGPAGERWLAVVRVHRGHVDLALARDCAKQREPAASERHRANAERRLAEGAAWTDRTDDLRTALRWLKQALQFDSRAWILAEDGAWFRPPGGWRIDVGDRQHAKATLRALLQAWRNAPGKPLATDDVLRAAWPGERVNKRAGASRVYVTISMLRDLGLRELILSAEEGGYLLNPSHSIAVGARQGSDSSAVPPSPAD
jgi:predicted ATPase